MKRNKQRSLKAGLISHLLLQVLIFSVVWFLVLAVYDLFFNGVLLEWIYDLMKSQSNQFADDKLYFWFKNKNTIIMGTFFVMILMICIRWMLRYISYFNQIDLALKSILKSDEAIPDFPNEFKEIEMTLKDVKHKIFTNEQHAKEAEQRKNDLVVYLAHDLKTPLTSIIGYLTLLEESPELSLEQRARYTSITLDKAYRLEQLINEFFDITRFNLQSMTLEKNRIDLSMMLYQLVDEFYPVFAEKELKAVTQIDKNLTIIGDADKLARVFDNLIRNAVSYSYEQTEIRVTAYRQEDWVRIFFRNAGDQISPEKLERIFEKFFRVDNSRGSRSGGAGLGLAIAKQIIELHQGRILAYSNEEYTEFLIDLPVKIQS